MMNVELCEQMDLCFTKLLDLKAVMRDELNTDINIDLIFMLATLSMAGSSASLLQQQAKIMHDKRSASLFGEIESDVIRAISRLAEEHSGGSIDERTNEIMDFMNKN